MIQSDPFAHLPNTLDTARLEELGKPAHRVLAEFIHGCSPDPATRTLASTALLLSLCQLAGPLLTPQVPSLILLNARETVPDPIDEFVKHLVFDEEALQPKEQREGPFTCAPPEHAPVAMANAIRKAQRISAKRSMCPLDQLQVQQLEERYHAAQKTGFGAGISRPYSEAWHEEFGLLTTRSKHLILRLNKEPDVTDFTEHVLHDPHMILVPGGRGDRLSLVSKAIAVSGSLLPAQGNVDLVRGIIELGLPFCLLPHTSTEPLLVSNRPALDLLAKLWPNKADIYTIQPSPSLPPIDWFEHYESILRKRLRDFPASYDFAIMQLVHQLGGACRQILSFACRQTKVPPPNEFTAMFWDLHAQALRGIVISIAGLAWYGYGFDPGCPQNKVLKVLKDLRKKGPTTKASILQTAHLKKAQRDILLERLTDEGLIQVEDKKVTATPYARFVEELYARSEFMLPPNVWAAVVEGGKATA